jgi:hypothetical protein
MTIIGGVSRRSARGSSWKAIICCIVARKNERLSNTFNFNPVSSAAFIGVPLNIKAGLQVFVMAM